MYFYISIYQNNSFGHLVRIPLWFLCDQLVLVGISFLALNLFNWLFCQLKKRSLQWESVWKYISVTALLASVLCFHFSCSCALTGSRLQQLGCQRVCFLVACFILLLQT